MSDEQDETTQEPRPDARAYGGGRGNFQGAPTPGPTTERSTPKLGRITGIKPDRDPFADIRSRNDFRKLRQKIYAEGGKWKSPAGITFGVTKEGWIYQHVTEYKEGVAQTMITALDADPPFIAVLATDLQSVAPEKREALLKELSVMAKKRKKPPPGKPQKPTAATPQPIKSEIIVIVDKDWLSKITLARWGTVKWQRHLKPTQLTLAARKQKGQPFHRDWILPGDTFEVISSAASGSGSP